MQKGYFRYFSWKVNSILKGRTQRGYRKRYTRRKITEIHDSNIRFFMGDTLIWTNICLIQEDLISFLKGQNARHDF